MKLRSFTFRSFAKIQGKISHRNLYAIVIKGKDLKSEIRDPAKSSGSDQIRINTLTRNIK
jgi:hypothetical protein